MASDRHRISPRKRPRQARAELTRQRILGAAAHVFAEHGYGAGTTNRIAERARISIGSLYQYYPNKDAILAELMTRHLDIGTAAHQRVEHELTAPFEKFLRALVHAQTESHRDDPRLLQVMLERAPRSPELLARATHYEQECVEHLKALLERHPEVTVDDTYTAARLVVSTCKLVVHQLLADPDPIDIPRFEDELVAMLTRYLTAPAPA